ncbi:MAG: pentapeptide repeat-containing protein [Candidatus Scalindua sp.]|jgi:uncharacterized protein YjbI with pentapeptide repeats|nr:pentapeptide repeat-containing protein [Candidatus Scalindua sp.]MBT5304671.1 pentapeptide repeat-containing protein [Candidatus Scalindua sp.]MBT6052109.1 pentapeptide repeat-containing protein [Candidatus Scalindua sp.]MBT6227659.1 pentapeptide repeat-containing protein [Candidatus Scalindua sp.]MBT6564698.1 pentapeptide repeat-containing protein [Candidatus Scalindua sp.]
MKKNSSKKNLLIISFGIGLYTIFGSFVADAGEATLYNKAVVKGRVVALQENDIGYDEDKLKRRLGVKSLRGADMSGFDLRWLYLQEADLARANLQGANLKGVNLRKANMQGADLRGADLAGANLKDVDFRGADLTGVQNFILKQITATVYDKETKFPDGITFGDIPKYNKDSLKRALGVKMLEGADAKGMVLRWGNFEGAEMPWSSFKEADLTGANLSHTNLSAANLRNANLLKADLQKANLKNASLQGANLMQANLQGVDLTNASLQGSNLSGADMQKAKLQATNLTGANLSGTDLRSVDLRGADLRGVKNITMKQLAQVIVDIRTRLPEGITFKQIKQFKAGMIPGSL